MPANTSIVICSGYKRFFKDSAKGWRAVVEVRASLRMNVMDVSSSALVVAMILNIDGV